NHVSFHTRLAGQSQARVLDGSLPALTHQVRPFEPPHAAQATDTGNPLHGAVGALAVAVAPNRPPVAGSVGRIHHRLVRYGFEFDLERPNSPAWHTNIFL